MKTLILHSGNLGCTAKAAQILANMIDCATVMDTALAPTIDFTEYDHVIFGTNVRMFMFNRRFKKYAKKWKKTSNGNKVFAYVIGASTEKADEYVQKAIKVLGGNAFAVFAGGELNAANAKGLSKKIIESVKSGLLAEGKPLPSIDNEALVKLSKSILL